jgi:phosphoserine phosphatase
MKNLALFDLDHTLLPIDSDYEWGQFPGAPWRRRCRAYQRRNDEFFAQYQAGKLDPVEYLEFALGTLAGFDPARLRQLHAQYMAK